MNLSIPKHGRTISVRMKHMSSDTFADPEVFIVAIDDDQRAAAAVRETLDFSPNDDRDVRVSATKPNQKVLEAYGLQSGGVVNVWTMAPPP